MIPARATILSVAAALLALCLPARAPAQDLIFNGGFERGDTLGWQVFNPGTQTISFTTTSDPALVEEGTHAAVVTTSNSDSNFFIIFQPVSMQFEAPRSLIRISGIIRGVDATFVNPSVGIRPIAVLLANTGVQQVFSAAHGDFAGDFDALPFSITMELPENPWMLQVQVSVSSGLASGSIVLDGFKVERVARESLAPLVFTEARVEPDHAGVARLMIDGQAVAPGFFFGNTGSPVVFDEAALAASAGVNLHQFPMNLPWAGTSTSIIQRVLQDNPDAYFLPRVELYPPPHVLARYADQQYLDENGQLATEISAISPGSAAYHAEVEEQIQLLVEIIHSSPIADRVIGYHFSNMETGEWFYPQTNSKYWDYVLVNKQSFRAWLLQKHGSIGGINAAWGTSCTGIVQVDPPSAAESEAGADGVFRSPATSQRVVDYARFHNSQVATRIAQLAARVKSASGGKSLNAVFYGYLHELVGNGSRRGMGHSGHLAIDQLLADPNVDILASPLSYHDRGVGKPTNLMAPVDSVQLAGKIFLQEDDSRTHIYAPIEPFEQGFYYPTEWDSIQALRRNIGHVVAHRQAIWWMDLIANGNYNLESYWTQANRFMLEAAAIDIADSRPYAPEVAVVVDQESYLWLRADSFDINHPALFLLRTQLHQLGAPVGWYTTRDLERLPESVKLVLFPNLFRVDSAMLARLDALKSGERTLMFLHAPGYVSESGLSTASMQSATGFAFTRVGSSGSTRALLSSAVNALPGNLSGQTSGATTSVSPRFYITGASTPEILGRYQSNNQPAVVWRVHDGWNAVFHGSPSVDGRLLKAIAQRAGVGVRVDLDRIDRRDGLTTDDRLLFTYATDSAGARSFLAPGERIPNGEFDPATTILHASGAGRWVSPSIGAKAATLAQEGDTTFARVSSYSAAAGVFNVPLSLRVHAQRGKTYAARARVRLSGYSSAPDPASYVFLNIRPDPYAAEALTFKLAEAGFAQVPDGEWVVLEGEYTHAGSAANPLDVLVRLQALGQQSFGSLDIDSISLREQGSPRVDVVDMLTGAVIAEDVSHWSLPFAQDEQQILEMRPAQDPRTKIQSWILR